MKAMPPKAVLAPQPMGYLNPWLLEEAAETDFAGLQSNFAPNSRAIAISCHCV